MSFSLKKQKKKFKLLTKAQRLSRDVLQAEKVISLWLRLLFYEENESIEKNIMEYILAYGYNQFEFHANEYYTLSNHNLKATFRAKGHSYSILFGEELKDNQIFKLSLKMEGGDYIQIGLVEPGFHDFKGQKFHTPNGINSLKKRGN